MHKPIRFYFDFASPYAYFSLDAITKLAAEHERTVEWRPILLWAVFKAHDIAPPMQAPAKASYFVTDMARSAAYYGLPYRHPEKLQVSSHLPARLYYAIAEHDRKRARAFARAVFAAVFVHGRDIADAETILSLAEAQDFDRAAAEDGMKGELGRERLAAMVDAAVGDNVVGSPFFVVDDEPFFGADRLPQIAWRLSQSSNAPRHGGSQ